MKVNSDSLNQAYEVGDDLSMKSPVLQCLILGKVLRTVKGWIPQGECLEPILFGWADTDNISPIIALMRDRTSMQLDGNARTLIQTSYTKVVV